MSNNDLWRIAVAAGVGLMAYAWTEYANPIRFGLGLSGDGPVLFAIGAATAAAGLLFMRRFSK